MVSESAVLMALLGLIDRIPMPATPARRGRPKTYSDRLFLKALLIMVVRHLPKVHGLLAVLDEPEMQPLRALLIEGGRYPTRRTLERRLKAMPKTLPDQIACLGRHLLVLIDPFQDWGRATAIDSTALAARGGVWRKKHRDAGVVPHTSIDTQAGWTKSGWHGWVYGWKLHLVTTVAAVWIPWPLNSRPPTLGTTRRLRPCWKSCRPTSGSSWVMSSTTTPDCSACASPREGCWSPPNGAATLTPTTALRSVASSISCALTPSRTSTPSSRPSSTASARCRPEGSCLPNDLSWVPCWCTNWRCSIASRTVTICESGSNPTYRRHDDL